jgi:hypothetical protein
MNTVAKSGRGNQPRGGQRQQLVTIHVGREIVFDELADEVPAEQAATHDA